MLPNSPVEDVLLALLAAASVSCRPTLSFEPTVSPKVITAIDLLTHEWAGNIDFIEEDDVGLATDVRRGFVDRIRVPTPATLSADLLHACRDAFIPVIKRPVVASGRIEPLWYLWEQSLSFDYHRYGNLGRRAAEPRRKIL